MSKYLDTEGLAYYHDRMSKVTVNITQSAHQTIDCFMDSPDMFSTRLIRKHSSNDWSEGRTFGLNDYNWQNDNPENQEPLAESFDLKNGQEIIVRVKPDFGYNTGTLVVEGGFISYRYEQELIDQNNVDYVYVIWCPGDVINISATPAVEKPKRTITLQRIQRTIPIPSGQFPYCAIVDNNGVTVDTKYFSSSSNVQFECTEGFSLHFWGYGGDGNSNYPNIYDENNELVPQRQVGRYYYERVYNVSSANKTFSIPIVEKTIKLKKLSQNLGFTPYLSYTDALTKQSMQVNFSTANDVSLTIDVNTWSLSFQNSYTYNNNQYSTFFYRNGVDFASEYYRQYSLYLESANNNDEISCEITNNLTEVYLRTENYKGNYEHFDVTGTYSYVDPLSNKTVQKNWEMEGSSSSYSMYIPEGATLANYTVNAPSGYHFVVNGNNVTSISDQIASGTTVISVKVYAD